MPAKFKNVGGRPRQGIEVKRVALNTRTTPDLRAQIETAALANGWSLTMEVEHRLRRSFRDDDIRRFVREEMLGVRG